MAPGFTFDRRRGFIRLRFGHERSIRPALDWRSTCDHAVGFRAKDGRKEAGATSALDVAGRYRGSQRFLERTVLSL